jgi:hypothetical protein
MFALAGCFHRHYRYADVPVPQMQARTEVTERAQAEGLTVEPERDHLVIQSSIHTSAARFYPLGPNRTRVEIGTDEDPPDRVFVAGRGIDIDATDEFGWSEWFGLGLAPVVGVGCAYQSRTGATPFLDGELRLSKTLHRFGQPDSAIAPRWSLIVGVAPGVRATPDAITFRPELTVSLSKRVAAWYVEEHQLPQQQERTLIDFSVTPLIEDSGRRGFEIGAGLRREPWAGIHVYAGWLSDSSAMRGGPIAAISLDGGAITSLGGLVVGLAVAAVIGGIGSPFGSFHN